MPEIYQLLIDGKERDAEDGAFFGRGEPGDRADGFLRR